MKSLNQGDNMKPIIHGENVLLPIAKAPKGLFKKFKSYIVGHSETGHHHVLEAVKGKEFDIMVDSENIYITSAFESSLVHKKTHDIHETVIVQPGIYKVNRKTEYDPFRKAIRQVWD
jgi:hypothetical protein